jgi:hypothetical protein
MDGNCHFIDEFHAGTTLTFLRERPIRS